MLVPARRSSEVEQWDAIKAAATAAILDNGGAVTHHRSVGRDYRAGYAAEQPGPFTDALRAAKAAVDPRAAEPGRAAKPGARCAARVDTFLACGRALRTAAAHGAAGAGPRLVALRMYLRRGFVL